MNRGGERESGRELWDKLAYASGLERWNFVLQLPYSYPSGKFKRGLGGSSSKKRGLGIRPQRKQEGCA